MVGMLSFISLYWGLFENFNLNHRNNSDSSTCVSFLHPFLYFCPLSYILSFMIKWKSLNVEQLYSFMSPFVPSFMSKMTIKEIIQKDILSYFAHNIIPVITCKIHYYTLIINTVHHHKRKSNWLSYISPHLLNSFLHPFLHFHETGFI